MPKPRKGERTPGSGRPRGRPNRVTREVKALLRESLDELGGRQYLVNLGREHPKVYGQLIGKLIPNEVAAKIDLDATLRVVDLSDKGRDDESRQKD